MRHYSKLFAGVVLCSALAGTAKAADIVETAVSAGKFETLVAAVKAADLVETLQGEGPFTVFAPTDEAFAAVPEETLQALLKPEAKETLQGILTYHVVPGKVLAGDVVNLKGAKTANGQRVDIAVKDGTVMIDGATVVATDIECDNGVIHVIDAVILPSDKTIPEIAVEAGAFKTLVAAASAAGLVDALSGEGPFTVFAPTDDAFAKLPEGTVETLLKPENKAKLQAILKYHVVEGRVYSEDAVKAGKATTLEGSSIKVTVEGESAKINDANLLKTDIDASNGVIHVIDSVILPPEKGQADAREEIKNAIAKGSELYNAGHHGACSEVYMTTMTSLVSSHGDAMPAHTVSAMKSTIDKAEHCECMNSRAWMLREGLETVYHDLASN